MDRMYASLPRLIPPSRALRRGAAVGLCLSLVLIAFIALRATQVGRSMPGFRVLDSEDKPLTPAHVRGRALVLFYESKDASDSSKDLKAALNKRYFALPAEVRSRVVRVGVVDCSSAMVRTLWKRGIRAHAEKRGVNIYCDWDGSMRRAFGFRKDDTNLMVADDKGVIRYFHRGLAPLADVPRIVQTVVSSAGG